MIRLLRAHLRSEAGIAAIYLLTGLGTVVATVISYGTRQGWNSPAGTEIKRCVEKANAAKQAIKIMLAADPNGTVALDDPNAVVLQQCQALAEQLKNDPVFGDKAGALGGLVENALFQVNQCTLDADRLQASAVAGQDYRTKVSAKIPVGSFSTDFTAHATLSGGGVAAAANLSLVGGSWFGELQVPGASSKNVADGAKSTITVTAAGTAMEGAAGQEKPITPRPDGTCPFGLVRVNAVCRITCTITAPGAVTWKVTPKIEATLAAANIDDTNAMLTWETENSKTQRLSGAGIPGGGANLGTDGSFPVKRGATDETYTLTASAPNTDPVTKTATVKARPPSPFAITLSSGGNDVTTDTSVTVGGKVTPAPPAGTTLSVAVGVNGVPVAIVAVGGDGSYFASVTLAKTTPLNSLVVSNPSRNLTACGAHAASTVSLLNSASAGAVQNVINAAVVNAGGGADSATASLVVTHAVRIQSAQVNWSGACSGANDTFSVTGKIVRAGEAVQLGQIPCGIQCPSSGLKCAPVARVSVGTSVGSLFGDAVWIVDIP